MMRSRTAGDQRSACWPRCRVHFMRYALAHVSKGQRQLVAALIRTVFAQKSEAEAQRQWRAVADHLRECFPKIGALMDQAEPKVLAPMGSARRFDRRIAPTSPALQPTR